MSRAPDEPLHVLLVEDNPGDIQLIREGFEESDVECSVTTVTDGEEALDRLHRRGEYEDAARPDLVLLDLNMPKVDGSSVLAEMSGDDDLRSVPVVVLSSSKSQEGVRETYELGAEGYFTKPVDPYEFISLVRMLVEARAADGGLPTGEYSSLE